MRIPLGITSYPLVLEVMLGQPVGLEPELLRHHSHVDDPFSGLPDLLAVVAAIGRCRRAGPDVLHLDAPEKKYSCLHTKTL